MKSPFTLYRRTSLLTALLAGMLTTGSAATFIVTSAADAGIGTLREAINNANASAGADVIEFAIAGPGVQTITLMSELPAITGQVTINGYSQPGASAGTFELRNILIQVIVPDNIARGITIDASDVQLSGLNIVVAYNSTGSPVGIHHGPELGVANNVWIWGCNFGTNAEGSAAHPVQGGYPIAVYGNTTGAGAASTISGWIIGTNGDGSNDENEGNIFSQHAVTTSTTDLIRVFSADNFVIAGNYFGLARDGVTALRAFDAGHAQNYGIALSNCIGFRIGTDGNSVSDILERNIFTGITSEAISILGNPPSGNYQGDSRWPNRPDGNNTITGNYFGTDKNGTGTAPALANRIAIALRGATYTTVGSITNPAMRNVIVNSVVSGVSITGERYEGVVSPAQFNNVSGNYIGVLADGTTPSPNVVGVRVNQNNSMAEGDLSTSQNTISQNIIAYNTGGGIQVRPSSFQPVLVYDNTFSQNSIYANTGLGINLGNSAADVAVTPNDGILAPPSTTNANRNMDYGVIKTASLDGNNLTIEGFIGNNPAGTTAFGTGTIVEFFIADNSPDNQNGERFAGDGQSLPHGEGRTYLGSLTADANGLFSGTLDVTGKDFVAGTSYITNTATEMAATGSTSEFGVNVTPIAIAGTVANDVSGLTDDTVNGTGTNAGGSLYVALYDHSLGIVVGVEPVNPDGTYAFSGAVSGSNYSIYLTTTAPTPGQTDPPVITPPAGWNYTGEVNCGITPGCTGDDGTPNGVLPLGMLSGDATATTFGIQECQSYLQIRLKSLSEEISPDFTYTVVGGGTYTLNDRPAGIHAITHISGDAEGGLFTVAAESDDWVSNPGTIYYKPSGSSLWQNTGAQAFKVQGGNSGGYISLVRSTSSVSPETAADAIKFRPDALSPETDITYNLAGQQFLHVAHNYDDMLYALVFTGTYLDGNAGTIYKKSVTDTEWVTTGITDAQNLTALPYTNRLIYARRDAVDNNFIFGADNDNTNVTPYGNPIPDWDDDRIEELAVTYGEDGALQLWALSVSLIYQSNAPGPWITETGINDMRKLASSGTKMLYSVLLDDASQNIPYRIFLRAQDGVYLDDERVRTAFNSNTVNIPVAPGTYTITQNPTAGWHITDIRNNEGDAAGSSASLAGPSATVMVSCGEVVVVEFENQLDSSTPLSQLCDDESFVEDFSSYKNGDWGDPLDGLISYHKATGNFGYGYYAIMPTTAVMSYGDDIFDHTAGDASGSMLVVDATFEKGIFYRRRFTGLMAGGKYSFGAWIANFNPPAADKPNVSFEIYNAGSGALITSVASGDVLTSAWQNFTTVFDSDGTDIELVLSNNTPRTAGNDLAIDDISFGLAIPDPVADAAFDCASGEGTITVTSPISISGNDFEYSIDGGAGWQTGTVFSGLSGGTYTVRVRYAGVTGSCESTTDIEVIPCITISGSVLNDANGMTDDLINGPGTNAGGTLYVALYDNTTGQVVDVVPVNSDGSYHFPNVINGNDYSLYLTTEPISEGQTELPVVTPPDGIENTGETNCVGGPGCTGDDNTPNGVLHLGIVTTDTPNTVFGINSIPVADPKEYLVPNSAFSASPPAGYPAETGYQSIPASSASLSGFYPTGGSLSGSDDEDCPGPGECSTGTGTTFTIETINPNTRLFYDFGTGPVELTDGTVIPDFDVNNLVIYGENGSGESGDEFGFTYSITDQAGVKSEPVIYQIETDSALPVSIASFTATAVRGEGLEFARLKWQTSAELNSDKFEVQRSADGIGWKPVGVVAANGESNRLVAYEFDDLDNLDYERFYRLKSIDRDGTFALSRIVAVQFAENTGEIRVYPNPSADKLVLDGVSFSRIRSVEILSQSGKNVFRTNTPTSNSIDVSALTAGVYFVKVHLSNGQVEIKKIVVAR